jgi:hypothetical protein
MVAEALAVLDVPAALPKLKEALEKADWWNVPKILTAIATLGGAAEAPYLAELVRRGGNGSRESATELAKLGEPGIAALIELMQTEEPRTRRLAALGLAEQPGAKGLAAMTAALEDEDPSVRQYAAQGLGWHGDEAALAALRQALADPEVGVRRYAVMGLSKREDEQGKPLLREALENPDASVVTESAQALIAQGEAVPIEPLIRVVRENRDEACALAAVLLGQTDDERAINALRVLYYEQPRTAPPRPLRVPQHAHPYPTAKGEQGHEWGLLRWNRLGDEDLWLVHCEEDGDWETSLFTGLWRRGWLIMTLTVQPDGRFTIQAHEWPNNREPYPGSLERSRVVGPLGEKRPFPGEWTFAREDLEKDTDEDGLPDLEEPWMGLDPQRVDTDGDGLPDGRDANPLAARNEGTPDEQQVRQAVFLHGLALDPQHEPRSDLALLQVEDGAKQEFYGYPGQVLCWTHAEMEERLKRGQHEWHVPALGPIVWSKEGTEATLVLIHEPEPRSDVVDLNARKYRLQKKWGTWVIVEVERVMDESFWRARGS